MAFATYSDVEGRWRTLTVEEQVRATTLLGDAETVLRRRVAVDPSDAEQADALKLVSCNMVIRAMLAGASDALGVDQMSATMGPFAQTAHFANPNGDLYITKNERKLLGIGGGRGRILRPACGEDADA